MAKRKRKRKKKEPTAKAPLVYGTPEFWASVADKKRQSQTALQAWTKPLLSDALGVHISQVKEANERNRRRGCSVRYDPRDGRAVIPDRGERRKLMKIEGMHDRDGGYGDG